MTVSQVLLSFASESWIVLVQLLLCSVLQCVAQVVPQEPVNRMFSVDAGHPTPDLACLVGFQSIKTDQLFRTNCSEAHKIEIPIAWSVRKELNWPKWKKSLRFASDEFNVPWTSPVKSWVCSTTPRKGTVTFNCVPENNAPDWYKAEVQGPAKGPKGRLPGCNGFVCYCNLNDYCNPAASLLPARPLLLLTAVAATLIGMWPLYK